jgi:hypothetical protein
LLALLLPELVLAGGERFELVLTELNLNQA